MDNNKGKGSWAWLPEQVPGVVKLMADRRRELGAAWVNECWKRGVLQREPGWFWAAEGALSIGTMWNDPDIVAFATARLTNTQCLLVLRAKE